VYGCDIIGQMERKGGRQVNEFDVILAINRQQLLIQMFENGQLDAEEFTSMYEATTRPEVMEADRTAFDEGRTGDPDTPIGKLGTLLFKLRQNKDKPQDTE